MLWVLESFCVSDNTGRNKIVDDEVVQDVGVWQKISFLGSECVRIAVHEACTAWNMMSVL